MEIMQFKNNVFTESLMSLVADPKNEKIAAFEEAMEIAACLDRQIFLYSEIDEAVGDTVDAFIRFWNKVDDENNVPIEQRAPIKLYIDTPGGSLTATFTMIDSIKLSKTPVYTITVGTAYSGGFFLSIAGHKKFAYPLASFLYHEGSVSNGGDAGKFRNFAKFYEMQLKQLKDIVLNNTKITEEEYEKHIKDDWWFTTEEALQYGIIDEIIGEFI